MDGSSAFVAGLPWAQRGKDFPTINGLAIVPEVDHIRHWIGSAASGKEYQQFPQVRDSGEEMDARPRSFTNLNDDTPAA